MQTNHPAPRWRKSSHSGPPDSNCVEVAADRDILVRDSKSPGDGHLAFAHADWKTFIGGVKAGRFRQ